MLSARRESQGRYRSEYSDLGQRIQSSVEPQIPATAANDAPAVISQHPTTRTLHGPLALGKVSVDKVSVRSIMLQGNHSQYGKFNGQDAGVLTFLTSFTQERGYRLDQVIVDICFLEHEPNDDNANGMLEILKFPSPTKAVRGEPRQVRISNKFAFYPKVQILGNGGELGGNERTHETTFVRSWCYSSDWDFDKHGKLTIAKWTWQADLGDPQVQHVGPLYSGVVVGPLCQPLWVGCMIQPRLSYSNPLKWLRRFVGRPNEKEVFTKILLSPADTELGPVIDGLDLKINQLMRPNHNLQN